MSTYTYRIARQSFDGRMVQLDLLPRDCITCAITARKRAEASNVPTRLNPRPVFMVGRWLGDRFAGYMSGPDSSPHFPEVMDLLERVA